MGPSSTGRLAFTESIDIVFHSLVSSVSAYLCSYSAKLNLHLFSPGLLEHVNKKLDLESLN